MSASDSYDVLVEQLGFPGSQRLRRVLEYLLTPDAARMVAALPGTAAEVAEKTGLDAGRVRDTFEDLFVKGVVFPRGEYSKREYFRFTKSIGQFHDSAQSSAGLDPVKDRDYYLLWQDFYLNEQGPKTARRRQASGAPYSRVVPAVKSIEGLSEVLPYENYRELLKAQSLIASVKCPCRYRFIAAGHTCEVMDEREHWTCLQFNRGAEYSLARGAGKKLSIEEALALCDQMEEDGLIHRWSTTSAMIGANASCNCCTDCCVATVGLDIVGLPYDVAWAKSRFAAYMSSMDACDGCQDCVDRCGFDAIEMVKVAGAKRMKASVDEDKCFGCGVCVVKCEPGALKMKIIRPAEHIPVAAAAE